MASRTLVNVILLGFLFGAPTSAQPAYQPKWENALRASLEAIKEGDCPATLMAASLRYACKQHLARMSSRLNQLGDIEEIEFEEVEDTPSGPVEWYVVTFDNGEMFWQVSGNSSGKLVTMWSPP